MTQKNKELLIQFGKVVGFGLACFAAVIASAGVWNAVSLKAIDGFYGFVAGLNLIVEGFGFYSLYKKLFKEDKDVEENVDKVENTNTTNTSSKKRNKARRTKA